jgi:hypothetical protein
MAFLPLILNTAQKLANDPGSKYFLPNVLQGLSGDNSQRKLLPIEQKNWPIGPIGGVPGQTVTTAFEDNWMTYLEKVKKINLTGQNAIAAPGTPTPQLNLADSQGKLIQIVGLQNVKVLQVNVLSSTEAGYHVALVLQSNAWNNYPALQVATPYTLSQNLCLANSGSNSCNGNAATDIVGSGTANILIQGAALHADVNVGMSGQDANRQVTVTLNALKLVGSDPNQSPALNVSDLTIDANVSSFLLNVWKTMAIKAITSPDGSAGIFEQIDGALNSAGNLNALATMLTTQLQSILKEAFGPVAAGALPSHAQAPGVNQVDQYLVDRASYALNTQGSGWYVPQLVTSISDPQLEPLQVASIQLPDIAISALGVTATAVALSKVTITGLSNLLTPAAQMVFKPNSLSFVATLGMLNPPPVFGGQATQVPAPPTRVNGNFTMTIMDTLINGTMAITLQQPSMSVTANSEGDNLDNMTISFSSIAISLPDLANLVIAVQLDSAFTGMINEALKNNSIRSQILQAVNGALASNLGVIGGAVTDQAKKLIQSRLS